MPRPRVYWIRLDDGVHDHPKVIRLAAMLRLTRETIVGHLTRLWIWVAKHRPKGILTDCDAVCIAEASRWTDDPQEWYDSLVTTTVLKRRTRREKIFIEVSGWDELNGRQIRERARSSMRSTTSCRGKTEFKPVLNSEMIPHVTVRNGTQNKPPLTPRKRGGAVSREARILTDEYADLTGSLRPTDSAYRSAQRRIDAGEADDCRQAADAYAKYILGAPPDSRAMITRPHNWFGRAGAYKQYLPIEKPRIPKPLPVPESGEGWTYADGQPMGSPGEVVRDRNKARAKGESDR